ncbi:MAG: OsmC family protein [Gammaproteobacteria bacterium]|nr:OsmC family protein [Gammaproteobacteria bacterium]
MSTELAAAIARSAEGFRADGARARATFHSDSTLQAGFHSEVKLREHTLTVDEPKGIGGSDRGPTPVELVLAALGTCQEITYRAFATAMGIALEGVSAKVEGDIDFRGFFAIDPTVRPGFNALRVNITLRTKASESEIARLVEAVNRHCPVLDMLSTPVPTSLHTTIVTD